MNILIKGQYLGQTFGNYENKYLLIKGSLHNQSESDYHKHRNSYLSILLKGRYIEKSNSLNNIILPGAIIFRSKNYSHKNKFIDSQTKCLNIEFNEEWFYKNEIDIAEDILIDFVKKLQSSGMLRTRFQRFTKLVKILDNEITSIHSLKSLSERVCVHPNYMARIFKTKMGISIGQYQIEKKLSLASKDLLSTNKNITKIAFDSGFYDEAHFIRTFKTKSGIISPGKLRKIVNS